MRTDSGLLHDACWIVEALVAAQLFYGLHTIFLAQSLGLERDKHAFFLLRTSLMDHVVRTGLYHRDGKPWDFLCEDVVGTVSHYTGSCACRLLMPLRADVTQMSDGDHAPSMVD